MKVIIAMDSFKGCLGAHDAAEAVSRGVLMSHPNAQVVTLPVSDGGDGFLDAFAAVTTGDRVEVTVSDPLRRPVKAHFLIHGDTAVIEVAQACGLALLTADERNPLVATTRGVGQLVAAAVDSGARHIIVGLGGTATSDAGIGMLRALIDRYAPAGTWNDVHALRGVRFTLASDVTAPLCGPDGAAHVFAPQKGATPAMVEPLERRAAAFAAMSARHFGYDRSTVAGAGAAGGLGYAFMQYLDADCRSGIDLLLEAARFDELALGADLIITGEGAADRQTLMGKVPAGVLRHAQGVPVCLLAGKVSDLDTLLHAGFARIECINPPHSPVDDAMNPAIARQRLTTTAAILLQTSL